MRVEGSRVWVVGASSGIGAAVASELVGRGARVAVTARREESLREVAGDAMVVVPADVTDVDSISVGWTSVQDSLGGVDCVVYAAGYWKRANGSRWDAAEFERHVQVNLLGLSNVLELVTPELVAAGSGSIAVVASVAGYRGLPGAEYYGATKAAQLNLTEALRASLRGKGVEVVTVSPGFVRTEMTQGNDFPMPWMVEPDAAAAAICDGIESGAAEVVFPWQMTAAMKAARLVPQAIWPRLTGRG
ncbi:SDR family NAD(P)-dependent oxidoreductase [Actinomycetota bacterium]